VNAHGQQLDIMHFLANTSGRQLRESARFACRLVFAFSVCAVLSVGPDAWAQVGYSLSVHGNQASFSGYSGLSEGDVLGGAIGLRFGDRVEVSGHYFYGDAVATDFSRSGNGDFGTGRRSDRLGLGARQIDLRQYGGSLRIDAWHGRLVPFVTAGVGILEFRPSWLASTESVYGSAGLGFALNMFDRVSLSVTAAEHIYQSNPDFMFSRRSGMSPQTGHRDGLYRWEDSGMRTLSASLKLIFGDNERGVIGSANWAQPSRLYRRGLHFAVETLYGEIDFNEALGFPESSVLAGISAGFDLGPNVGLRGFYWRDTNQDSVFEGGLPEEFGGVEFFGGEVDIRFNPGRDIMPFVLMGVGYMNAGRGASFTDRYGFPIAGRNFATGGVGLDLGLGAALRLNGSVRSVLMSTFAEETFSDPGQIVGSLMYTFGVKFSMGGRRHPLENQLAAERAEVQAHVEAINAELAQVRASLDSLASDRATPIAVAATNGTPAVPSRIQVVTDDSTVALVSPRSNVSGQTVTIPVPETGEIYIRFGDSPAAAPYAPSPVVTDEETTAREVSPTPEGAPADSAAQVRLLTPEQVEEIVSRVTGALPEQEAFTASELAETLRQMEARMERHITREMDRMRERDLAVTVPAPADTTERRGILGTFGKPRLAALQPHLGLRMGGESQFLLGVRGDVRFSRLGFRVLPEAGLGISDQVSIAVLGNAAWDIRSVGPLDFYGGPGIGFFVDKSFSEFELVLNLLVGTEFYVWGTSRFFAEFSTLDLFDVNRLMLGYRLQW